MTCADFQKGLPDYLERSGSTEERSHETGCEACSELVSNLRTIVTEAKTLQATDDPSPRVWNSIEIALRQEGLIRQPRAETHRLHMPSLTRRWGAAAWLVPALGVVVLGAFLLNHPKPVIPAITESSVAKAFSVEDQQMVQEVAARAPMMTASYESSLANVNQYIRDAQAVVDANPNDGEAQRSLMEAYEQKTVLNEIALDRSLQ